METRLPINRFPKGSLVRIQSLEGCPKSRCRLCAMGLTPGTVVEVRSNGHGPCRLKVRGTDVVLGRNLSLKVFCVAADSVESRDACSLAQECRGCDSMEATPCGGTS